MKTSDELFDATTVTSSGFIRLEIGEACVIREDHREHLNALYGDGTLGWFRAVYVRLDEQRYLSVDSLGELEFVKVYDFDFPSHFWEKV